MFLDLFNNGTDLRAFGDVGVMISFLSFGFEFASALHFRQQLNRRKNFSITIPSFSFSSFFSV